MKKYLKFFREKKKKRNLVIFISLLFLIFAILFFLCPFLHQLFQLSLIRENLLDGLVGALIGSAVNLILILITLKQLRVISSTSRADFIHRLKNDFFTPQTRKLFILVDLEAIRYVSKNNGEVVYFEVEEEKFKNYPEEIKKEIIEKKFYTQYEIEDILLGPLEDIGLLLENGIIKIDMVYPEFCYYVKRIYENNEIRKYIEDIKKVDGEDIYKYLETLYCRCKEYES